jgi:hypothetical protein
MPESLDALGQYLQRLRSWKRVEPPPLALLHRWERELKLKDSDIRAVHQLALTHRRRAFDLLQEGRPEFLAELREALLLEPSDLTFLRHILIELSRHEYGGENWNTLLNQLFTRYILLSPNQEEAKSEVERLFPRFKFRKKSHRTVYAIIAGMVLAFLIGGGGLTIAWFVIRGGGPALPVTQVRSPVVDWSGLNVEGLRVLNNSFQQITLGEDSWLVVRGRMVAEAGFSELLLGLAVASSNEEELRRFQQVLVSSFTGPLRAGQSLPFRWVLPMAPDAPLVQSTVRVERSAPLIEPLPAIVKEFPIGQALTLASYPIQVERAHGVILALQDVHVRNTHSQPLRLLTLKLIWKVANTEVWQEIKQIIQPLDTPLEGGLSQPVRFRLNVPQQWVPEGDLQTEWEVLEEERSP